MEDVWERRIDFCRFLKTDGKVLRNHAGKGEAVTLRGTNIGGWQVMESWMCPTNAKDQKTAIATLTERFGKETAEDLIKTYENAWIQEQDFDNLSFTSSYAEVPTETAEEMKADRGVPGKVTDWEAVTASSNGDAATKRSYGVSFLWWAFVISGAVLLILSGVAGIRYIRRTGKRK